MACGSVGLGSDANNGANTVVCDSAGSGGDCGRCDSTSSFDLKRKREALEHLRRDVEALDDGVIQALEGLSAHYHVGVADYTAEAAHPCASTNDTTVDGPCGCNGNRGGSGRTSKKASQVRDEEEQFAALEVRSCRMSDEVREAEEEFRMSEAVRDSAKVEWSHALGLSAAAESKVEKRLVSARNELEEVRREESQQEGAFRVDREKIRQRLRNLRMQLRQAERHCADAEAEENFSLKFDGGDAGVVHERASSINGLCKSISSKSRAMATIGGGGVPLGGRVRRNVAETSTRHAARRAEARSQLSVATENFEELQYQYEELLQGSKDLEERELSLRKACRLSDQHVKHWSRRSELLIEESSLRQEQESIRIELRSLDSEADAERRDAVRLRQMHEHGLAELGERDLLFQQHQQAEMDALSTIDGFLASPTTASEEHEDDLAEWLEADIGARQVEHVKRRLAEIVADAGARAQVLEQAVTEVHADLDKRAAIILELAERRDRPAPEASDSIGKHSFTAGSEQNQCIEREALEGELEHQRGLFELRGEQARSDCHQQERQKRCSRRR
eukprot:TRINITY_DN7257_c1_g1_i2.p1 TRINITY_DN7257_c1_g1~~TRINITY_DN7257_c1_g1_i2.p1  ORF type:complete len:565 (-),score=132.73 TRINITY_DN7257_c1_g1_i2:396-2090(-)